MDGSVDDLSYWTKRRKIEATVAKDIANLRRRFLESHSEEIPLDGVSLLSSTVHSADANYHAVYDTIAAVSDNIGSCEANICGAGAAGSTFKDFASSDPRTLLKTPRTDVALKKVSNGSYHHFGLAHQIESQIVDHSFEVDSNTSVSLQINVDGVPIFKSSVGQFRSILSK